MPLIKKIRTEMQEVFDGSTTRHLGREGIEAVRTFGRALTDAKDAFKRTLTNPEERAEKKSVQQQSAQPGATAKEQAKPWKSLTVEGGKVRVDAEAYDRLRHSGPFQQYVMESGEQFLSSVTMCDGKRTMLPLANLIVNVGPEFVVRQLAVGEDFTRANLTILPELRNPEPIPTREEYEARFKRLREARNKKR